MTPERALEPNRACAERFRRALDGDIIAGSGDVAQLGERRVRNAKVEGSIPFVSTRNVESPSIWRRAFSFWRVRGVR